MKYSSKNIYKTMRQVPHKVKWKKLIFVDTRKVGKAWLSTPTTNSLSSTLYTIFLIYPSLCFFFLSNIFHLYVIWKLIVFGALELVMSVWSLLIHFSSANTIIVICLYNSKCDNIFFSGWLALSGIT